MKEKLELYNFINDPNIDKLDSISKKFNPFKVLGIEEIEIRHSNFLAWLLNPSENHSLGDYFLKKFLTKVIAENSDNLNSEIDITSIYLNDFSDAVIYRERDNIDILIASERNNLVVIVENKVNSKESKHQLKKYLESINNQYNNYNRIPIYLTLYGDESKYCSDFIPFSHELIYSLVKDCIDLKKDAIPKEIGLFINYYLKTLEKKLGMDEDLKRMCTDIYKAHKNTIELILDVVKQNEDSLKPSYEDFIRNNNDIKVFIINSKWLWFLPNIFIEKTPKIDAGWNIPYPYAFWFSRRRENKISFHIEVGPFIDPEKRIDFMNYLEKKGYKIRDAAKRIESKYTRIYTETHNIKDFEDKEEVLDKITNIYKKSKFEIDKFYEIICDYDFSTNQS